MLDVRPFQETLYKGYCGPASLKIILSYYGTEKSEEELAKMTGADTKGEVDDVDIVRVAEALGFCAEVRNNASLDDIEGFLKKDVPVIVDWFTRGRSEYPVSDVADGHYSVVIGLDESAVYVQDPEIGGVRRMTRDDFLRVWFDFSGAYAKPEELIVRQLIAVYPNVAHGDGGAGDPA